MKWLYNLMGWCYHDWGKWYPWACTWQQRRCLKCNKSETICN